MKLLDMHTVSYGQVPRSRRVYEIPRPSPEGGKVKAGKSESWIVSAVRGGRGGHGGIGLRDAKMQERARSLRAAKSGRHVKYQISLSKAALTMHVFLAMFMLLHSPHLNT